MPLRRGRSSGAGSQTGIQKHPKLKKLEWTESAHTGTANELASFDSDGNATTVASSGVGAPVAAQYVTLATNASLTAERVLTAGTAIGLTDNGAGSTVVVAVNDAELTALAGLTSAANKLPYFTGSGTASVTDLTPFSRGLLADAAASNWRTDLSLVPGTDIQAFDADLSALAANSTDGLWAHTGAGTGAARTITGSSTITVSNGDGVAGNPTLSLPADSVGTTELAGYSRTVVTSVGYTTVTIPAGAEWVHITTIGPGGAGNAGVTGDNSVQRAGGRGGGCGGESSVLLRATQIPATVEAYVGTYGDTGTANQYFTVVEFANSGLVGTGKATTLPHAYNVVCYALGGVSSSGAAGGAATSTSCIGFRFGANVILLGGTASDAASANGHPADVNPFGNNGASRACTTPGCSGAGKTTVAAAIGGGYAAIGNFGAVAGGAAGGGSPAVDPGTYGGGGATWVTACSNPEELAWSYGGCGGGSNLAGQGGDGADAAFGSGGGGGGAGTTGASTPGNGGTGLIIIETW